MKTSYFICNRESFRVTSVTSIGPRPTNNPWETFIRMTQVGWLYVKPAPFKQTNKLMDIVAFERKIITRNVVRWLFEKLKNI